MQTLDRFFFNICHCVIKLKVNLSNQDIMSFIGDWYYDCKKGGNK